MPQQTAPHTESQRNSKRTQTDLEPGILEQEVGRGDDAALYEQFEGAQTGTDRAPRKHPEGADQPNTQSTPVAYEGGLASRAPGGDTQGISNGPAEDETARQQKVVKDRPDALAGVDHSR